MGWENIGGAEIRYKGKANPTLTMEQGLLHLGN
jgi:hypothetical protein